MAGTEPESVCPLHAGSGDPSPYLPDSPMFGDPQQEQRPGTIDTPQRRAEEQRKKAKETGIRKLLRRIFGDN